MINSKIEYFVTLAECLNFTQTANKHSVSQTAISQYIASLEKKLEVKLFRRSSHSVTLTEAGKFYYERVKFLLHYYDDTEKRIRAIDEQYSGYVKVGIGMYEYCNTEDFFAAFLKEYPTVKVDIFQYEYSELTEKLKTGQLDVIVASDYCENAFQKESLKARTLFSSANYLVTNLSIADKYAGKPIGDILRSEFLITNCEDHGPSSVDYLHSVLQREFGFISDKIVQTNSINAQLLMVRSGHGVALVPGFIKELNDPDFVKFPLSSDVTDYKLMTISDRGNSAASLIMDFQGFKTKK